MSVSMLNKHLERLSSGYRVNRAGDDAAGLAISEKMRFQITGLNQGIKNAKDGISLCQTAEGALEEVHQMLRRIKELSTLSANGTYSELERHEIQKEIDQILSEIDRISEASNFNGRTLFVEDPPVENVKDVPKTPEVPEVPEIDMGDDAETVGDFTVSGGKLDVDFTFKDGVLTILTDTALKITTNGTATTQRIEVAGNTSANITLASVNIHTSSGAAFHIADNNTGKVSITLEGNNTLASGQNCAGLQKNNANGSLTIQGTGTLTARGGDGAAGIGGGNGATGSNITIDGGTVTATGGNGAAGIGSGYSRGASDIKINGGTVTAIGGGGPEGGAGIGSGALGFASSIKINGGTVTATGGAYGAGIGGGITINGGTVTAKAGSADMPAVGEAPVFDPSYGHVTFGSHSLGSSVLTPVEWSGGENADWSCALVTIQPAVIDLPAQPAADAILPKEPDLELIVEGDLEEL